MVVLHVIWLMEEVLNLVPHATDEDSMLSRSRGIKCSIQGGVSLIT